MCLGWSVIEYCEFFQVPCCERLVQQMSVGRHLVCSSIQFPLHKTENPGEVASAIASSCFWTAPSWKGNILAGWPAKCLLQSSHLIDLKASKYWWISFSWLWTVEYVHFVVDTVECGTILNNIRLQGFVKKKKSQRLKASHCAYYYKGRRTKISTRVSKKKFIKKKN